MLMLMLMLMRDLDNFEAILYLIWPFRYMKRQSKEKNSQPFEFDEWVHFYYVDSHVLILTTGSLVLIGF